MTQPRHDLLQAWVGVGLAPLVTALSFQIRYMMVPFACQSRAVWSLHLVSAVAILVSVLGLCSAWRTWQHTGAEWPHDQDGPLNRNRFLGVVGIGFSMAMLLMLVFQMIPVFFVDPCTIG